MANSNLECCPTLRIHSFFLSKETPFLSAEFLSILFCTNSGSAFFDGLDLRIASNHVETKLATAQTIVELEMHVSS